MRAPDNPWLRSAVLPPDDPAPMESGGAVTGGPTQPQQGRAGLENLPAALPLRTFAAGAELWVVGAHGGAGESRFAQLSPDWQATGHAWPQIESASRANVLLVARTDITGLLAAQRAVAQWAGGRVPHVNLLGLAFMADAPGAQVRPLKELQDVLAGGVPRVWRIPWVPAWRVDSDAAPEVPRPLRAAVAELHALIASTH